MFGVLLLVLVVLRFATRRREADGLPAADRLVQVARVIDGDTLLLETGHRVRLIGVNTPEMTHADQPSEPFGREASKFTRSLAEGKRVRLEYDRERRDEYRRILAYVFVNDRLLNAAIIEAGFSRAETRFPYRADRKRLFEDAESVARAASRGLWSERLPASSEKPGSSASDAPFDIEANDPQ